MTKAYKGLLDPAKTYRIRGWEGIAWYYDEDEIEMVQIGEDEAEAVPTGRVRMVMVGDDKRWSVDPDDCAVLPEDSYCPECGQVGCTALRGVYQAQ